MVIHFLDFHGDVICSSRVEAIVASKVAAYDTGAGTGEAIGCWGCCSLGSVARWLPIRSFLPSSLFICMGDPFLEVIAPVVGIIDLVEGGG